MDGKTTRRRIAIWLLVAIGLALVIGLLIWAGHDWSEAIVQGLAALGGAWFWAYRSRPRVTLRLTSSDSLYLELANLGNRVAKHVEVRCEPPIPWKTTLALAPREEFGLFEDFGDMDRDQRYVVLFGSPGKATASALENTTFEVSHESPWGFGRRKSKIRFGTGVLSTIREDAPTAIGQIARKPRNTGTSWRELKKR